jgi:transcriptional regulator with XRE-family HTH domain
VLCSYSQAKFADAVGASLNTVRAWEQGWSAPMPRYRAPMARVLGVSLAEIDRLIEGRPPDLASHAVPEWLTHYESLVEAAGRLAEIEFYLLPGLLQTRNYATCVQRNSWLRLNEDQVNERVEKLMKRQAVLSRPTGPLEVEALLLEWSLREAIGDDDVMAGQLNHLVELAERPNIEIRLIPADGRATSAIGAFQLLTRPESLNPFMACTVDVGGVRYHEDPDIVTKFADRFAYLASVTLDPDESIARIEAVLGSYQ